MDNMSMTAEQMVDMAFEDADGNFLFVDEIEFDGESEDDVPIEVTKARAELNLMDAIDLFLESHSTSELMEFVEEQGY